MVRVKFWKELIHELTGETDSKAQLPLGILERSREVTAWVALV